ncbi:MAG: hypothetical protein COV76_08090 [Candidatus Omnitrophica bacterium CG11_big_fil_rev_8_21_14_0_20_64_10]|nr:MAG: hypothetical protein COV76_08090 [Candidatus Omnitrophica bacterium CG11_big_fil_rev_8_21_14_0_20_64_10]
MGESWRWIVEGAGSPAENMARDAALAEAIRSGRSGPAARFYRWAGPAFSFGRRMAQADLRLPAALERSGQAGAGLPVVRRPTGGGVVRHTAEELTYAVAFPMRAVPAGRRLAELPGEIHRRLAAVLIDERAVDPQALTVWEQASDGGRFCFDSPAPGDLLLRGRKVAGSAMRVWREGGLIQGSLQGLGVPSERLVSLLRQAIGRTFLPVPLAAREAD